MKKWSIGRVASGIALVFVGGFIAWQFGRLQPDTIANLPYDTGIQCLGSTKIVLVDEITGKKTPVIVLRLLQKDQLENWHVVEVKTAPGALRQDYGLKKDLVVFDSPIKLDGVEYRSIRWNPGSEPQEVAVPARMATASVDFY